MENKWIICRAHLIGPKFECFTLISWSLILKGNLCDFSFATFL